MKRTAWVVLSAALLFSGHLVAADQSLHVGNSQHHQGDDYGNGGGYEQGGGYHNGGNSEQGSSPNADVVVDMPPEAWTQGQSNQPPCLRCCTYENRSYTEGSVVKMEGVLLQCSRDERSIGTNNLTWQTVK
ncbi:DUF1496 domain-containing protein [Erwinia sp. 9145]|uniref:DUF1496 domain-containing protein n=1 Tax=Erwinia sp. 9145 TaxID=1500895 RepID=UPI0009E40B52|nr:DUF1496 domain-containing protein [Erwinia sp. 9145]